MIAAIRQTYWLPAMISTPHVLLLWALLAVFFVGAFAVLVNRERKARRARREKLQKDAQKKDQ